MVVAYTKEELLAVGLPIAMERLIQAADRRQTVSYADVARYIGRRVDSRFARSWHHIGNVVGSLMDRVLEVAPKAPPINTLVVSASGLPGEGADGYVEHYLDLDYSKLSDARKREIIKPLHEIVWNFLDWREIGERAFGRGFVPPEIVPGESDGKAVRQGLGGPAKTEDHRRLKEYVAKHPQEFGAPKECKEGMQEFRLLSTDEIDVLFVSVGRQLAVEVKSKRSNLADIERGIFQCVKYRALLQAQSSVGDSRTKTKIRALLVSEQSLSPKLKRWATKLQVKVQIVKPLRVRSANSRLQRSQLIGPLESMHGEPRCLGRSSVKCQHCFAIKR